VAENILINISAKDDASKKIKSVQQEITNLGKKSKQTSKNIVKDNKDIGIELNNLGSQFRYLSLVTGIVSAAMIGMMSNFVDAARQGEQASLKLGLFAIKMGEDMDSANQVAQEFANTGLISITESAEALSNLLATGLGLDKSKELMHAFLSSASVAKENIGDTFGDAMIKATQGVRIFQERQIDAAGMNTQLIHVFREYANTVGKTATALSNAEKYQAIYNYYTKEGIKYEGAIDAVTGTFSGTLAKLSQQFFTLRQSLGNTLIPLIGTLSEILSEVSTKMTAFAKSQSFLTGSIMTGVVVLSTMVTALATVGALYPLLTSGVKAFRNATEMLTFANLKFLLIAAAVSAAVGLLIYGVLKATGKWDIWSNKIKNLQENLKKTIQPLEQTTEETEALTAAQQKQLETLARMAPRTFRDLREGLREWVDKHDKSIKDLRSQIGDLEKDYKHAIDGINNSFSDTMDDMSIDHQRKVEDLTRDIDEEVSKGIWADQTRIRELKLELKRENEDYARSYQDKSDQRNEDLAEEKSKYDERLVKLQEELDKELELEKKYGDEIAQYRSLQIRDEFQQLKDNFNERMSDLALELQEVLNSASEQTNAINGVTNALKEQNNAAATATDKVRENMKANADSMVQNLTNMKNAGVVMTTEMNAALAKSKNIQEVLSRSTSIGIMSGTIEAYNRNKELLLQQSIQDALSRGTSIGRPKEYQTGGIIPGSPSQAVPIIAHGGETVLPAGISPITVNINNPTVRRDRDIQILAEQVEQVLSRKTYLKRFQ
jgi:gas vesicle protein